ncbi:MAG: hypothetical protein DID91_2727702710 [Candidatus Nitrotoga sp. MKT]|nr:MAG: hypothetical protein DID91_2727702710 [Candidatus Nitrotoga sp. MKT]
MLVAREIIDTLSIKIFLQYNDNDNNPIIQHTKKLIYIALTLASMLSGADAIVGSPLSGTIVYGTVPRSIPTLSGFMLVILGLLFAVLAFRVLRAHSASKALASIVAVGVLVLGAASGSKLIQQA